VGRGAGRATVTRMGMGFHDSMPAGPPRVGDFESEDQKLFGGLSGKQLEILGLSKNGAPMGMAEPLSAVGSPRSASVSKPHPALQRTRALPNGRKRSSVCPSVSVGFSAARLFFLFFFSSMVSSPPSLHRPIRLSRAAKRWRRCERRWRRPRS